MHLLRQATTLLALLAAETQAFPARVPSDEDGGTSAQSDIASRTTTIAGTTSLQDGNLVFMDGDGAKNHGLQIRRNEHDISVVLDGNANNENQNNNQLIQVTNERSINISSGGGGGGITSRLELFRSLLSFLPAIWKSVETWSEPKLWTVCASSVVAAMAGGRLGLGAETEIRHAIAQAGGSRENLVRILSEKRPGATAPRTVEDEIRRNFPRHLRPLVRRRFTVALPVGVVVVVLGASFGGMFAICPAAFVA